jgi:hypothetical protein
MVRLYIGLSIAVAAATPATAKPIAFADGTTVMAEYGAGTMQEVQVFYAPRHDYSLGGGHVDLISDVDGRTEHINYARLNWLASRWNLDDAQAPGPPRATRSWEPVSPVMSGYRPTTKRGACMRP